VLLVGGVLTQGLWKTYLASSTASLFLLLLHLLMEKLHRVWIIPTHDTSTNQ
jgi:hypothetical protein